MCEVQSKGASPCWASAAAFDALNGPFLGAFALHRYSVMIVIQNATFLCIYIYKDSGPQRSVLLCKVEFVK